MSEVSSTELPSLIESVRPSKESVCSSVFIYSERSISVASEFPVIVKICCSFCKSCMSDSSVTEFPSLMESVRPSSESVCSSVLIYSDKSISVASALPVIVNKCQKLAQPNCHSKLRAYDRPKRVLVRSHSSLFLLLPNCL